MERDKQATSATSRHSRDSGFESMSAEMEKYGRLSIFILGMLRTRILTKYVKPIYEGKIYQWVARAKIMSLFSESFLMAKSEDSSTSDNQ